jgi:putative ABC transport system ATP-binding protein
MGHPAIVIRSLDHYYGEGALKKQVLFDIDLEIRTGEIVIMTGPSGSGKTTLLSLIGCLRSPQSGSLKILDQELCGASKLQMVQFRRQLGYIFQAHNLLKSISVRENVMMPLELSQVSYDEASRMAEAMLTQVGLAHRVDYYPEDLSGGQKQRVAIARALVTNPKLLLADEPTAALDKQSGRDVVELMQTLAREQGCTILLVTHDNRILDIADRIIHMEDGKLAASNAKAEGAIAPSA